MLIAEARVETTRSGRYIDQLCQHVSRVAEARPQMQADVEWSDDRGVISFGWGGRCTLRADPRVLSLRAEAPDEEGLRQVLDQVSERLERFGRRDHLRVTWTSPQGVAEPVTRSPVRHDIGGEIHD
jgi:hypothetical protein